MKKLISFALLIITSISSMAQSTDFLYPFGRWSSPYEEGKGYTELYIVRERNGFYNYYNMRGIGSLDIVDKNGTAIYESVLTYEGKEKKAGTCIYYFSVKSTKGRSSRIGTQKVVRGDDIFVRIVEVTGDLANRAEVKEELEWVECSNGMNYDPTSEATSDQDLMRLLRQGLEEDLYITGFGNLRQYINAHAKLDMSKPIYAKPKGAGSINIRQSDNAQSAKIGELRPGDAVLVVNEYNGWCEVMFNGNMKGYVSLSVVTLTNTNESASLSMPSVSTTSVTPSVPKDAQNYRKERLVVMNGGNLYPYNVVCASFDNIDEANSLCKVLIAKRYPAQVAQNPDTGRYRVIAASFDNHASAVQSREKLRSAYPDAWLLYRIY